jgi:hypothetical protein
MVLILKLTPARTSQGSCSLPETSRLEVRILFDEECVSHLAPTTVGPVTIADNIWLLAL